MGGFPLRVGMLSRLTTVTEARKIKAGMKEENILSYPDKKELIANINSLLKEGDCVLIKASRKYKFEEIFEAIK